MNRGREENVMLAIAVLRSRVAPVLDWCSKFVVYSDVGGENDGREITFENSRGHEILKSLHERGVGSVICGALTRELLDYAQHLDIHVIHGVAGNIPEILNAYRNEELHQPRYRLPGCRGPCHYRRRRGNDHATRGDEQGKVMRGQWGQGNQGPGRGEQGRWGSVCNPGVPEGGQTPGAAGLEGAACVCPRCGKEVFHQRGIPCFQRTCPQCGQSMRRK